MSDVANRIIGFAASALQAMRSLWSPGRPQGHLKASIRQAELEGLQFAFYARLTAIIVVSAGCSGSCPGHAISITAAYAFAFFLLGYIPYRPATPSPWRDDQAWLHRPRCGLGDGRDPAPAPGRSRPNGPSRPGCAARNSSTFSSSLPRPRSPTRRDVSLWTGVSILVIWSIGVFTIYSLPDTMRFNDVAAEGALTSAAVLELTFQPTFVGLTAWYTQLVATSLFTLLLTLAVWRSRRTLLNQVEAEVVRADLARYVSPDVAEALAKRGGTGFGDPATRTVAVLFADIVGFTKLTETLSPERTFALLRSFHERSCAIVFKHGGTLDKYLGDGFMATFGSIDLQPDAPARALACAFELQQEIERWSRKRSGRGADPLRVSIGIHCGPVTVGNLGGRERVEFTVVGDVVNVASRLEEITRAVGGSIVASEDCIRAAGDPEWLMRFQSSREIQLRGRQQGILVHIAT